MKLALQGLRAVNNVLYRIVAVVAALLVAVMVVVVFGGAAIRNLTGIGFGMVQELPPMLVPWVVFPMAGVLLRFDAHITVDFLPSLLSSTGVRILRFLVAAVAVIAGGIFFIAGLEAVSLFRLTGQVTEMDWEFPIWWIYLSFPVGFAMLISFAVENMLDAVVGENPEPKHLEDADSPFQTS